MFTYKIVIVLLKPWIIINRRYHDQTTTSPLLGYGRSHNWDTDISTAWDKVLLSVREAWPQSTTEAQCGLGTLRIKHETNQITYWLPVCSALNLPNFAVHWNSRNNNLRDLFQNPIYTTHVNISKGICKGPYLHNYDPLPFSSYAHTNPKVICKKVVFIVTPYVPLLDKGTLFSSLSLSTAAKNRFF